MAWEDVPERLAYYTTLEYAPPEPAETLLAFYGATTLDEVPEFRRQEFEDDLEYRIGACENIEAARVVRRK